MQEQQTTVGGPITLDDVRQALGETSALDTNASKIRTIIGRGSFATIQKHLDTLRAQRVAAAQPAAEQSIPKAPQDAVEMLWAAAWGAAQTKTLARLEALSAERDGLQATTAAQAADVSALTEQLDTLEAQAEALASAQTKADAIASELAAAAAVKSAGHAQELAFAQAETTHVKEAAAHAAELAQRDTLLAQRETEIKLQAHQSTIDRMTEQLADLKALHIVAATAHPAPVTKEPKEPKK
jgi:hypothetical protein